MTTWADTNEGDIIEGRAGGLWVIESKTADSITLTSYSDPLVRRTGSPGPTDPVVIAIPAATAEASALALARVALNGEIIAQKNESDEWMTPPVFAHPGSMLAHLYVFHGVVPTGMTHNQLVVEHHRLHQELIVPTTEHVHDPDFHTGREGLNPRAGDEGRRGS